MDCPSLQQTDKWCFLFFFFFLLFCFYSGQSVFDAYGKHILLLYSCLSPMTSEYHQHFSMGLWTFFSTSVHFLFYLFSSAQCLASVYFWDIPSSFVIVGLQVRVWCVMQEIWEICPIQPHFCLKNLSAAVFCLVLLHSSSYTDFFRSSAQHADNVIFSPREGFVCQFSCVPSQARLLFGR